MLFLITVAAVRPDSPYTPLQPPATTAHRCPRGCCGRCQAEARGCAVELAQRAPQGWRLQARPRELRARRGSAEAGRCASQGLEQTCFAPARSPPCRSPGGRALERSCGSLQSSSLKPLYPPQSHPTGFGAVGVSSRELCHPPARLHRAEHLPSSWGLADRLEPEQQTEGGGLGAGRREERARSGEAGRARRRVRAPAGRGTGGGLWAVTGLPAPAALQLRGASLKLCR